MNDQKDIYEIVVFCIADFYTLMSLRLKIEGILIVSFSASLH